MIAENPRNQRLARLLPALWALLPIVTVAFVWLRSLTGMPALLVAQLVFLTPVLIALITAERAYAIGQPGIERRAWGLLSMILAVLLLSEGYYSWYQVTISPAGPQGASAFDVLNMVAGCLMLFMILQLAGVGRLSPPRRWRLILDAIAFSAVTFLAIYHLTVAPVVGATTWLDGARWAVYSLVGVLIILGVLWLVANARSGVELRLMSLVALSVGIFATGMMLWPIWRAGDSAGGSSLIDGIVGAVYLVGYYLLMMAGLTRIAERDQPWRTANINPVNTEGVVLTTALSLYVLVGAALVGTWLYTDVDQPDAVVYFTGTLVAVLALVARTGVAAVETVSAQSAADIDPTTGAMGGVSFLRRLDEAIAHAERTGGPLSLTVWDMDGFSEVNQALGHAGGDRILADVAQTADRVAGRRAELFRTAGDEFALVGALPEPDALVLAAEVLAAIRALSPQGYAPLSASLGVAGWAQGDGGRDDLVHRAKAAEAWAKYHGKGRVVRFDERIVRALGVEERLRVQEAHSGMEVVRALVSASDARDPRNYYHARNVAALSVLFAESLELDSEHVRRIELAAMLHDCGKLGLVDSLLADVLLTSRQQMAAREHAVLGERFVTATGVPGVAEWVRHHHERWDGAGYPDELSGEAVPLESRIIALADAYDAMTSGARNRFPVSRGAALQEIDLGMGSRFDPMLAERFIEVVGNTASLGWSDEWGTA